MDPVVSILEWNFEISCSKHCVYTQKTIQNWWKHASSVRNHTMRNKGRLVMVWVCFAAGRLGELKATWIAHRLALSCDILCNNCLEHTSRLCKNYFEKKERDGGLSVMSAAPQSPNLSPIKSVWDKVDRGTTEPTNAQLLWECFKTVSHKELLTKSEMVILRGLQRTLCWLSLICSQLVVFHFLSVSYFNLVYKAKLCFCHFGRLVCLYLLMKKTFWNEVWGDF